MVHRSADGVETGTWTPGSLVAWQFYGCVAGGLCGGRATLNVLALAGRVLTRPDVGSAAAAAVAGVRRWLGQHLERLTMRRVGARWAAAVAPAVAP